jgi:hypothetical protein
MVYNEDAFMDTLDKWDDKDKRARFINRMQHKFNSRQQRT